MQVTLPAIFKAFRVSNYLIYYEIWRKPKAKDQT